MPLEMGLKPADEWLKPVGERLKPSGENRLKPRRGEAAVGWR
jgi:hypothetical protein